MRICRDIIEIQVKVSDGPNLVVVGCVPEDRVEKLEIQVKVSDGPNFVLWLVVYLRIEWKLKSR